MDKENNRAELGYCLAERFWNMGITSEAVQAVLKFGFDQLGLNKIIAVYLTTNQASGKVMIKNGMVKEAEFKEHDIKRGGTLEDNEYVSLIQYRMLKSEYDHLKETNRDTKFIFIMKCGCDILSREYTQHYYSFRTSSGAS